MNLITLIIFGAICGALARAFLPGKHDMGLLATTLLGIVGIFAAGLVGVVLGLYNPGQGAGVIAGVLGTVGVLWGYEQFVAKNPTYPKEVQAKFQQMFSQVKTAAKGAVSNVSDVAFKETPKASDAAGNANDGMAEGEQKT